MLHPSTDPVNLEAAFERILGHSEPMRQVFRRLERVAQTDSTVLISGESGTGKELVAAAIHRASPRRSGPYIAVNMAAVPDTLIESELFGHVKGAFTDAGADRQGRFEAADGGTLFIDEIGDLKLPSQAKLLRVLESRQITPVGSNRVRAVDVRVIAATSRRLDAMVGENQFREDLYYRLNVVAIALPPLRDRWEDIPLLVDHFLDEVCRAYGKPRPALDRELEEFLRTYPWPGNIRQLRNCVESMVVLSESEVLTKDHLPAMVGAAPARHPNSQTAANETLEDLVRTVVLERLRRFRGNRTRAAQSLDISVRTLQRRLKRWGLGDRSEGRTGADYALSNEELMADAY